MITGSTGIEISDEDEKLLKSVCRSLKFNGDADSLYEQYAGTYEFAEYTLNGEKGATYIEDVVNGLAELTERYNSLKMKIIFHDDGSATWQTNAIDGTDNTEEVWNPYANKMMVYGGTYEYRIDFVDDQLEVFQIDPDTEEAVADWMRVLVPETKGATEKALEDMDHNANNSAD